MKWKRQLTGEMDWIGVVSGEFNCLILIQCLYKHWLFKFKIHICFAGATDRKLNPTLVWYIHSTPEQMNGQQKKNSRLQNKNN